MIMIWLVPLYYPIIHYSLPIDLGLYYIDLGFVLFILIEFY